MSDLANSCEYLTSEKLCSAVSADEKAKASRQARCKNSDKTTCCYLCMVVFDCASPCRFLGSGENTSKIDSEENLTSTVPAEQKPAADKTKNDTSTLCSLCNVELSKTKTKFRIDGWEESNQKSADNHTSKSEDEILSVIVYLCPKCGKIEFRADEKLNMN